jgi:ankyrin repeat protein
MFAAGVGYRDKNTRGTERDALAAVKILVDAGLDLGQVNSRGETALHGATDRGADSVVQFLVERGADLNVKTKQGFTPLDVAMGKSSLIQLPIPKPTTVALLRKLGGLEGKDVK